jgi:eukaryotic-like serine/threonine-protein kinase
MASSPLFCDNCGAANRSQGRYCSHCGRPLSTIVYTPTARLHSLLKQRYQIISLLGQGGMGAVYKAEDIQLGNRPVAVKEMSQRSLSPQEIIEATDAFKREAHMLASLVHPNLPRIYDHFNEGGLWYLVMDYIEGKTLEEHLKAKGGMLPLDEVVALGIQLCTVLDYLHTRQKPIIFRDLKPTNVMLTPDGHLYLIDFGIARHFKPGQARDTANFGSPGYAAPEQYGKAQTTPRSDIYSLGATLHYLLSGSDPSDNPFIFGPLQLQRQVNTSEIAPLISQMVALDANTRPESMAVVKKELQRITTEALLAQSSINAALSAPKKLSPSIGTLICTYDGHAECVNAVAWSPDGTLIASASDDGTADVWDLNGDSIVSYDGHSGHTVHAVAWSPDGTLVATGSSDNTADVWNLEGDRIVSYNGHSMTVFAVAWSSKENYIASGSNDKTVDVWDAEDGEFITSYSGHSECVNAVAWSPTGKRIASASDDDTVDVWDAEDGELVTSYSGHSDDVYAVAWSPNGRRIASASDDETVQVWIANTGNLVVSYDEHSEYVRAVAWSPDGTRIASGSDDTTVQIWDATTARHIYTYTGHSNEVNAVAWSPDGKYIASAGSDGEVHVWQAEE